jgi:hypothetical protein
MMTLIASILFLSALAASVLVIATTLNDAMPRIAEVIEAEFAPAMHTERRINFGAVKRLRAPRSAEVVAFPVMARVESEFKLAA